MSKKIRSIWVCSDCGGEHSMWSGKCSYCSNWNTLKEAVENTKLSVADEITPINLKNVSLESSERIKSAVEDFNLVLGGGIVRGSVLLIGGQPGIGKSTLIWQVASSLPGTICYVAGEESPSQIKIRSQRLGIPSDNVLIFDNRNIDNIIGSLKKLKPSLLIVDSIQTVYDPEISGTAGSIIQVRSCTLKLIDYAKKNSLSTIIIGHVTKDGEVAGPKTLEHLVDGVFYLEGVATGEERFLRATKNRFGSTDEIGIFEMSEKGLQPSSDFGRLEPSKELPEGVSRTAIVEGSRVIFLEVQSLVQKSNSNIIRRNSVGFDLNRLHMISAIVSKHTKYDLSNHDIYLNVSEGFKLRSTMADTAAAMAMVSSFTKKPLNGRDLFIGELDLSGGLHLSSEAKKIIKISEKAGFNVRYKARNLRDLI